MDINRRKILLTLFKLADLLIMLGCFLLSTAFIAYESGTSMSQFLAMRIKVQNFVLLVGFTFIWYFIFSSFNLYKSRRLSSPWSENIDILKATAIATLVIFLGANLFWIRVVSPAFLAFFWTATSLMTILSRAMVRYGMSQIRKRGRNLRYMLIVGTNDRALTFAQKIIKRTELGYSLLGFVDQGSGVTEAFRQTEYSLVANLQDFPEYLRNHIVDEVVIALPLKSFYDAASQVVSLCEEQGIIVRFLDIFSLKHGATQAENFSEILVTTVYTGAMRGSAMFFKRVSDLLIALCLSIVLSPLYLIIALAIKATSPGPVFLVQERIGLNKRRFRLYKFRTMVPDAEKKQAELEHLNEVNGAAFKIKDDPRITPLGKFLRKTSLDELPQLFNVIKGDMSLVGPRPLPVRDYNGFDQDWQRRRFSVRPGITCLWQISGRSNISFEKWMELDMQYIDQWSLWLDLKILFRTIPAVFLGFGAA